MTNTRQSLDARDTLWISGDPVVLGQNSEHLNIEFTTSAALQKRMVLNQTLEKEVIPRLVLSYGLQPTAKHNYDTGKRTQSILSEDISLLAELVVQKDNAASMKFVARVKTQGISIEAIYSDLLAPTARCLGEKWKADKCNFTEVTIGTSRLQQIMLSLSPEFEREKEQYFEDYRILFSPMPGEQHTFGLVLVEEYFRRAGWNCCKCSPKSERDLLHMVRSLHFDVVGLSAGCEASLKAMSKMIEALRKISLNSSVAILVGGPIFLDKPNLATHLGADETAKDGSEAILKMQKKFGISRGKGS